jgi:hypothetical protein
MIFYLALDENGFRQIRHTQEKIREVNKDFKRIDIATHSAGLEDAVQELLREADELRLAQSLPQPAIAPVAAPEPVSSGGRCDSRCTNCHRQLTTSVNGAISLAIGEDLSFLGDWIQDAPDWAIPRIHEALREREKNRAET